MALKELLEEQVERALQVSLDNKDNLGLKAHLVQQDCLDHVETRAPQAPHVFLILL